MSSKRQTLADQLADLDQTAPIDLDPEDVGILDSASKQRENSNGVDVDPGAGREHYVDVGPSAIRKAQNSRLDPKYDGVRVSRQQLLDGDSDNTDLSDHERDEDGDSENRGDAYGSDSADESPAEQVQSAREDLMLERRQGLSAQQEESSTKTDSVAALKKTREEERNKGKAVVRQLEIHDSVVSARIQLQKCVTGSNRLPLPDDIPSCYLFPEAKQAADSFLAEALRLSEDLFTLREKLLHANNILERPPRKKRRIDPETVNELDWEEEFRADTAYAMELEVSLHPHLLNTLQKWSNKVLAVAPAALMPSNRTKFSRAPQAKSATTLIEETLLDHPKLLDRTRTCRGKGERIGTRTLSEANRVENRPAVGSTNNQTVHPEPLRSAHEPEIFDDTDFYQQQLREIIDVRQEGLGGTSGNNEWRVLQKQRKAKKDVDTKASKGRKLRYEVHQKLQHLMVPVPVHNGWHEEQIDELFASLLGKGFERATPAGAPGTIIHPGGTDVDMAEDPDASRHASEGYDLALTHNAVNDGFRVFG